MVEGLIWLFSLASGRIPPVDCASTRVTIKRFMLAVKARRTDIRRNA
jgi:hypothetical protein